MNFPTVPTDSLYKFLAITGVIFIISGIYFISDKKDDFFSEIQRLRLQEDVLQLKRKTEPNTPALKLDSLTLHHKLISLSKNVDQFPGFLNANTALIVFGVFFATFGFGSWYLKIQRYSDMIIKNESTKTEHQKSVIAYQVRFEKEYNLYQKTWIPLSAMDKTLKLLITEIKSYKEATDENKGRIFAEVTDQMNQSHKHFLELLELIDHHAPFFPKEIHEQLQDFRRIGVQIYAEAINAEFLNNLEKITPLNFDSYVDQGSIELALAVTNLIESIRRRIELSPIA